MAARHDEAEACRLCGTPAFAAHADGAVYAGYGSRHDTTSFVEVPATGVMSAFPEGGCPVCDCCIDGMLAKGRLVAWTSAFGRRPTGLDAVALEAVFLVGARRARKRVDLARDGIPGGVLAALQTLAGVIALPTSSDRVSLSLASEPRREADAHAAGAATVLTLAACLRPFGEEDVAPMAKEWASRVVRDRESVVAALAALAAMEPDAVGKEGDE